MSKFLGFLVFLMIFLTGFSMLLFLGLFVGYWLTLLGIEQFSPKLLNKIIGHKTDDQSK
jgi:F0F1-type ATP synthase assembly protein I